MRQTYDGITIMPVRMWIVMRLEDDRYRPDPETLKATKRESRALAGRDDVTVPCWLNPSVSKRHRPKE